MPTHSRRRLAPAALGLLIVLGPLPAVAKVTRVEVARRSEVGSSGYEKIVGIAHFAVDPADPRNAVIVDLDKAPKNADGRVEFSADLYILRPKDQSRSNGVALVEVSNRGRRGILSSFNRGGASDPETDADLGDAFLIRQGYTLVWVGWQFDVQRRNGAIGLAAPLASGVTAIVRAEFTPNGRDTEVVVTDLAGYQPADAEGPDTALTVRTGPYGPRTTVPRGTWRLTGNTVSMPGGFEPGKTYEISYRTARVAVAGVGLAAFRDIAAWIRHAPDALARARYTYAFGSSQSGRFLRTFLYYGFNADEQDRPAYDAVVAHIAGAARLSLNERGATPNALSMFSATRFPYADSETRDPITGATDGLLDNPRARRHQPKVFYTNSSVEYWGGGRAAALVHTSPDGKADVALPANVRAYLFSGTQHSPGPFPPRTTTGQQPENPVQYWWTMRALLVAMDRWVRQGEPPPPSQYPRLSDGSLVAADAVRFPEIPSVASPRIISPARHGSAPLPLLVPQVDESGNERAGVHASEVAVPLATYTGWNFRSKAVGGTDQLVNLAGSAVAFARTPAERSRAGDPRKSVEERHRSREQYLAAARDHAESLVRARYLLPEDVPAVMTRMEEVWEAVVGSREALIGSR